MKLSSFENTLSVLYLDRFDIHRYDESLNEDGTVSNLPSADPTLSDIPCKISYSNSDLAESSREDTNPIEQSIKLFCRPDVQVNKGDMLMVRRMSENGQVVQTFSGTANAPNKFLTHQEIMFTEVGDA